ncbi:MAG: hypothetical protein FJ148_27440 [Deltaproteobacteria bacterium]|nr:hypothetical protein [Deltaproteobacteria bacterium]
MATLPRSHRASFLAVVGCVTASLIAQVPQVQQAPPQLLQQFDVVAGTMQSLAVPPVSPPTAQVAVSLAGQVHVLDLYLHDVRGPGFQLWEEGPQGRVLLPTPACVTYRGELAGEPGSAVAATIDRGSLTAMILRSGGEQWLVQPVAAALPGAAPAMHVVYRKVDNKPIHKVCGTSAMAQPVPAGGTAGTDGVYATQIAIEADPAFYQLNGSNSVTTQNDITTVMNVIDLIYRRDMLIGWVVTQISVLTTSDPYSTNDPGALLGQMRLRWIGSFGGVTRDVAHLFTGRNIDSNVIGIAYLGTICDMSYGYGLSESLFIPNLSYRAALTAHELGHNYNAQHCNGAQPCNIMCASLGGCSVGLGSFGPNETPGIIAYRNSLPCLSNLAVPPQISAISPSSIKSWRPAVVNVSGVGLNGANRVDFGPVSTTTGLTVANYTAMTVQPPVGLPLGVLPMTVTTPDGTSAVVPISVVAPVPCEQYIPATVAGGTTATWAMGGWPFDYAFTLLSLTPTLAAIPGGSFLRDGMVLWSGPLDDRGMASFGIQVPAGVLSGVQFYTQMLDLNLTTMALRSASSVSTTTISN